MGDDESLGEGGVEVHLGEDGVGVVAIAEVMDPDSGDVVTDVVVIDLEAAVRLKEGRMVILEG